MRTWWPSIRLESKIQVTDIKICCKVENFSKLSSKIVIPSSFPFLFFRSKKYMEREASPYGEKQQSPKEGSRNIPWVLTRQPDIWSTLREKRPHPHMEIYFCIPNCWCFTHTTSLTHSEGKGTNIYQVQAACSGLLHTHSLQEDIFPCFESVGSSYQACPWKAHGGEHSI